MQWNNICFGQPMDDLEGIQICLNIPWDHMTPSHGFIYFYIVTNKEMIKQSSSL